jgi:hypothetical protein
MEELTRRLKRFEKRVRLVRAWRGMAVGLCIGGIAAATWAVLDWFAVLYAEWAWLGALAALSALIGGIVGYALRVPVIALANSIDRRANLKDRLSTAREHAGGEEMFDEPLMTDASSKLESIRPSTVFPFKVGRWQGGGVALTAVAAAIFLLGNTPILLNDQQKQQLEELKREGAKVERIIRENLEDPDEQKELTEAEKRLGQDLLKLKKDLEKGRLNKEEALQRANELAKEAEKLLQEAIQNTDLSLQKADSALDKLRKDAMEQAGMKQNADPNLMKMSDAERQAAMQQLQSKIESLQNEMTALQSQMAALQQKLKNPNLSAEERKKLEDQMKALNAKLDQAKAEKSKADEDMEALKLSKEAQEVFQKMMQDPLYKELQELAQKLAQNNEQMARSGQPKLTKEEREKLLRELEELAKKLKDDKAMKEYLKALLEAMKNANGACRSAGLGGVGLRLPMPGAGAPSQDIWAGDTGMINKLSEEQEGKGKTQATMVSGARREGAGEETYIEIKAPTNVGTRSSIPYIKVLPSYKKKAEAAMNRQEIPKEHQKRVKEYFESLNKGG